MGSKISLCQAITTPDTYVKLDSPQQELQKQEFLTVHTKIKLISYQKFQFDIKKICTKCSANKFTQGIYIGPVNTNSLPHTALNEKGLFLYESGFLYIGQLKYGKRQGQGILIDQDGQYYNGEWNNNNPNGKGQYISMQSLRSYKGAWLEGIQQGQGQQIYQDGSNYVGEFSKGVKNGKGKLQYSDGTFYNGQFKQNSISGFGICEGKFHKYQGQWQDGKMHGNGVSTWIDEKGQIIGSYIGQYKYGLKHGYGQYKWGQKKVYKGKWQQGDMRSEGILLNYQG